MLIRRSGWLRSLLAGALTVAVVMGISNAPAQPTSANRAVRISRAFVFATEDVQIPARAAGQIVDLRVEEGDRVKTGQVIAVIDDELSLRRKETAEAEFEAAKAQADSDAEVRSADARTRFYAEEFAMSEKLKQRDVASQSEFRKVKVQWENAVADADVARVKQNIAKLTQEIKKATVAQTAVELRNYHVEARLKSDGEANVEEVMKHVGDWVQLGESIVRLVRMEEVRVEGQLKIGDVSPEEVVGQPVIIEVTRVTDGRKLLKKVEARIDYVGSVVDADDGYRVMAKVQNVQTAPGVWLLVPGTKVEMVVQLKGAAVAESARK